MDTAPIVGDRNEKMVAAGTHPSSFSASDVLFADGSTAFRDIMD